MLVIISDDFSRSPLSFRNQRLEGRSESWPNIKIGVHACKNHSPSRIPRSSSKVLSMAAGTDQSAKQLYEFGPFRVDAEKEILLRGDQAVPLAPKTFQVLLVLMRNKKEVVTKDELMRAVWPDTFVEEANLSRNIFLLRKALGESPQDHQYIVTVPGRGYRFAEDVQLLPEQELNIVCLLYTSPSPRD